MMRPIQIQPFRLSLLVQQVLPVGVPPENLSPVVLAAARTMTTFKPVGTGTGERLEHQVVHLDLLAADRDAQVAVVVPERLERLAARLPALSPGTGHGTDPAGCRHPVTGGHG